MSDKLLNTLKIQSTISPYMDPSPSKSTAQFIASNKNLSSINPQDDYSYLQQNDQLFKIINFDNGNAVKDCKALLDMMKEQFLQEKQKLSLFYQTDLSELLQGLKVNNINVKKTIINKAGQQIQSKIKNIKIKKRNEIFNNYSKLMTHSLKENQRIQFIKQSSKITHARNPSSQPSNDLKSSQSILQKIMQEKRNKVAIQNSSKINQQWKDLQGIMKNRAMCEKILQEALMFERYYHIMKKEKQKVLAEEGKGSSKALDTGLNWRRVKTETGNNLDKNQKKSRYNQSFFKRPRTMIRKNTNSQSSTKYSLTSSSKKNNMCMQPKHLRLPESIEQRSSSLSKKYMSEQDYYRSKFMVGLKRDQYLRQINKVNEEIVQKKNVKNNCLISNVLGLIRQNTIMNKNCSNQESASIDKIQPSRKGNRAKQTQKNQNAHDFLKNNKKIKQLSGSQLTKILRRLFLIYASNNSSKNTNNITDSSLEQQTLITLNADAESLSLMSQKSLNKFFTDFHLEQYLTLSNEKIAQILQKDYIDQFQFIQLVHLLSAAMHQSQYFGQNNQGMIYTNINYWISKKILHSNYAHLLEINEQSLLNKLHSHIIRLRKYFRFQEIINNSISDFIHSQKINKLKIKTIYEDFDYVLETLWSMKIYPQFVNKNTVRFYFEYLKEDKDQFIINSATIRVKIKQHIIVQNIIWLIISDIVNKDQRVSDYQQSEKNEISKDKLLEKIFVQKVKLIIKSINNITDESTNNDQNQSNQEAEVQ